MSHMYRKIFYLHNILLEIFTRYEMKALAVLFYICKTIVHAHVGFIINCKLPAAKCNIHGLTGPCIELLGNDRVNCGRERCTCQCACKKYCVYLALSMSQRDAFQCACRCTATQTLWRTVAPSNKDTFYFCHTILLILYPVERYMYPW